MTSGKLREEFSIPGGYGVQNRTQMTSLIQWGYNRNIPFTKLHKANPIQQETKKDISTDEGDERVETVAVSCQSTTMASTSWGVQIVTNKSKKQCNLPQRKHPTR